MNVNHVSKCIIRVVGESEFLRGCSVGTFSQDFYKHLVIGC